MPAIGLRQLATIIGIAAGLAEIIIAATITEGPKAVDYTGVFVYIVPLIMIGGAVLVSYAREAYLGAGIMVVTFAVQHVLMHLQNIHLLPMALVIGAVVVAMRVDQELRAEESAQEA